MGHRRTGTGSHTGGGFLGDNWNPEPDVDWYKIELSQDYEYAVELWADEAEPERHQATQIKILGIYDHNGIANDGTASSGSGKHVSVGFEPESTGLYFISVGSEGSDRTGVYLITVFRIAGPAGSSERGQKSDKSEEAEQHPCHRSSCHQRHRPRGGDTDRGYVRNCRFRRFGRSYLQLPVAGRRLRQDSTKVRANASRNKAMSYGRMNEKETQLAAEVAELLRRAEEVDEVALPGSSGLPENDPSRAKIRPPVVFRGIRPGDCLALGGRAKYINRRRRFPDAHARDGPRLDVSECRERSISLNTVMVS